MFFKTECLVLIMLAEKKMTKVKGMSENRMKGEREEKKKRAGRARVLWEQKPSIYIAARRLSQ